MFNQFHNMNFSVEVVCWWSSEWPRSKSSCGAQSAGSGPGAGPRRSRGNVGSGLFSVSVVLFRFLFHKRFAGMCHVWRTTCGACRFSKIRTYVREAHNIDIHPGNGHLPNHRAAFEFGRPSRTERCSKFSLFVLIWPLMHSLQRFLRMNILIFVDLFLCRN